MPRFTVSGHMSHNRSVVEVGPRSLLICFDDIDRMGENAVINDWWALSNAY